MLLEVKQANLMFLSFVRTNPLKTSTASSAASLKQTVAVDWSAAALTNTHLKWNTMRRDKDTKTFKKRKAKKERANWEECSVFTMHTHTHMHPCAHTHTHKQSG